MSENNGHPASGTGGNWSLLPQPGQPAHRRERGRGHGPADRPDYRL